MEPRRYYNLLVHLVVKTVTKDISIFEVFDWSILERSIRVVTKLFRIQLSLQIQISQTRSTAMYC